MENRSAGTQLQYAPRGASVQYFHVEDMIFCLSRLDYMRNPHASVFKRLHRRLITAFMRT